MSKEDHIENDDHLKGLKGNRNPFRLSHDYFEDFSSRLEDRIMGYEELKDIAPLLSEIPKYNPFEVPAGYFDELPALVQERCNAKPRNGLPDWLLLLFRPRFVVPVLSVLLIAFFAIRYVSKGELEQPQLAEEISLEEQCQQMDESVIIEALTDGEMETEEEDDENEKIMNYLLDNNIDETNLNNEL